VVWNKQFAAVYPFEHETQKDADIRLEVWAVDSNNHNNDYLLDYSDSRVDNVEHIYSPADPNITDYEIVVTYSNDHGVSQPAITPPYGLAWNVAPKPARDDSLLYDLNADGAVNELDVTILLDNVIASIETSDRYIFGDINSDGLIDANDLGILLKYIEKSASSQVEQPGDADLSNLRR
jgi:hypothetical protein